MAARSLALARSHRHRALELLRCGSLSAVLILVRHGRTALNAQGRLQGRIDEPLDDVGREQAKAVVAHVGEVDELISSPLRRATETAEFFGMPFEIDERWIELAYGTFEGTAYTDFPSVAWDHWKADASWAPEGGESLTELAARVQAACLDLFERARDDDVAVVTHVSPMKAAVAWVLGSGIEISWRSHLSHASVCRIDLRESGPVLYSFNETAR
jgi:broad specificity phosphatase PhoE